MLALDGKLDSIDNITTKCECFVSIIILCNALVDNVNKIEESIFHNKDLKDYEIIIIEYGLNGEKRIYSNKKRDLNDNIKVFFCESRNISKAYNLGANISTGKFLFFLNADINLLDLEMNKIEKILNESNDECIIPVINDVSSGQKAYGGTFDKKLNYIWTTDKVINNKVLPLFKGVAFIIKKSLFQAIGGFNEKFKAYGIEDHEFSIRLWTFGYKAIINEEIEVTLNTSLKPLKSYGTTELDIIYNYLCLAYLHFNENNFCKILKLLKLKRKMPMALAMISTDYTLMTLRNEYIKAKKFDENDFFKEFCIEF